MVCESWDLKNNAEPRKGLTVEHSISFLKHQLRDHPYIILYILEGCLTLTPPIVINRHILAYPPPPLLPSYRHTLNIKIAFIFNPSEIKSFLFSLMTDPFLYARDQLRSNCKHKDLFSLVDIFWYVTFCFIVSYCHKMFSPPPFQTVINHHILACHHTPPIPWWRNVWMIPYWLLLGTGYLSKLFQ